MAELSPADLEFNRRLRLSTRLPDAPDGSPRFRRLYHDRLVGYCDVPGGAVSPAEVEVIDLVTGLPPADDSGVIEIEHVDAEFGFLISMQGRVRIPGHFEIRLKAGLHG